MAKVNLATIPFFADLTKKELNFVSTFLITKKYNQNEKIFKKGTTRDKIIIITSGLAALQVDIKEEDIIAIFKPYNTLGEMALIQKASKHQYDLIVNSAQLEVLELSVYNWHTVIKKHPDLANKIYKNISTIMHDRLTHANNKLATLFATGKIVGEYKSIDNVAEHILDVILKIIPSNKAMFMSYYQDTNKIHVRYSQGYKKIHNNIYFNAKQDVLLNKIIDTPRTIILNKNEWPQEYKRLAYSCQTMIVSPIRVQDKVLGFIVLGDKTNKNNFSHNNLILLEAITSQIVPAIQHINLEALESAEAELKEVYIDY
jgi:CRP-like cAMP-binding protein